MTLIEWRDDFRTGDPSIDHEHEAMIALLNKLHGELETGADKDAVMDFLGEVHAQIAAHFALEEKIMRERGYDQYEDHKADHEHLLDGIRDIMDEHARDAYSNYEETLASHLGTWFTEHFRTRDARLHKMLG